MISLSLPGSTAGPCCAIVGLISCGALILPVLAPRGRCAVTGEVSSGSRLTPLFTGVRGRGILRTSRLRSSKKLAPMFGCWHHALVVEEDIPLSLKRKSPVVALLAKRSPDESSSSDRKGFRRVVPDHVRHL